MPIGLVFANGDMNEGPALRSVFAPATDPKAALTVVGRRKHQKHTTIDHPHSIALVDSPSVLPKPYIIAADGGLAYVYQLGLHADLVIGDMDSVNPRQLENAANQGAEIQRYPAHKDETDLELALVAAARHKCDPVRILGGIGDRLDQTISNVYLLTLPVLRGKDVRLVDGKQTIWLLRKGSHKIEGQPGDTLSLVPLSGSVKGIVTEQLEYPLRNETLKIGPARGVSNVFLTTTATVTFASGLLMVIHTVGRA